MAFYSGQYHSEADKGSKERPTDHETYANNYDLIFGKKRKIIHSVTEEKVEYRVSEIEHKTIER